MPMSNLRKTKENLREHIKISLRLVTIATNDDLLKIPVTFSGNFASCQGYAKRQGFHWVNKPTFLFGGYWANSETGDCLMPT